MLQCRYKVKTAVEVTMCTLDEVKKELASKNNVELIQSLTGLSQLLAKLLLGKGLLQQSPKGV